MTTFRDRLHTSHLLTSSPVVQPSSRVQRRHLFFTAPVHLPVMTGQRQDKTARPSDPCSHSLTGLVGLGTDGLPLGPLTTTAPCPSPARPHTISSCPTCGIRFLLILRRSHWEYHRLFWQHMRSKRAGQPRCAQDDRLWCSTASSPYGT